MYMHAHMYVRTIHGTECVFTFSTLHAYMRTYIYIVATLLDQSYLSMAIYTVHTMAIYTVHTMAIYTVHTMAIYTVHT
jgi:hypothetical protein